MTKVKTNFADQTIYVGLDVHKRSWNAALYLNDQYLRNVHQPPSPQAGRPSWCGCPGRS